MAEKIGAEVGESASAERTGAVLPLLSASGQHYGHFLDDSAFLAEHYEQPVQCRLATREWTAMSNPKGLVLRNNPSIHVAKTKPLTCEPTSANSMRVCQSAIGAVPGCSNHPNSK